MGRSRGDRPRSASRATPEASNIFSRPRPTDRSEERDERGAERALSGGVTSDDPFSRFSQAL